MRQQKTIELDGATYITSEYPATSGWKLATKLIKIFGKPFSMVFRKGMEAEITPQMVAEAIQSLAENVSEEDSVNLIKDILHTTMVHDTNGYREIIFDTDFMGHYLHMLKLVAEVLNYQYHDFLGGFAAFKDAGAAILQAKMEGKQKVKVV